MRLIFVYNAEGDAWSRSIGFLHKLIRPDTYPCSLCALTHDRFGARKEWKEFVQTIHADMEFWYFPDFISRFGKVSDEWPAIFALEEEKLSVLVCAKELRAMKNTGELTGQLFELMSKRFDHKFR